MSQLREDMEALLNERTKVVAFRSPTKDEIKELKKFVRSVNKDIRVNQHKVVGLTTFTVSNYEPGDNLGKEFVKVAKWLLSKGWIQTTSGDTSFLRNQQRAALQYNAFYSLAGLAFEG